jgi:inhibitor of cysteine peptidase
MFFSSCKLNNDKMTVQIKPGEVYTLELPSNPSTGYTWTFNPKVSQIITIKEVSDGLPSDTPGASHETIFEIKGIQKGNVKVTLTYRRVWETDIAPKETKRITVKVK